MVHAPAAAGAAPGAAQFIRDRPALKVFQDSRRDKLLSQGMKHAVACLHGGVVGVPRGGGHEGAGQAGVTQEVGTGVNRKYLG